MAKCSGGGCRAKILICDNEQSFIDNLSKLLENEMFNVYGATECLPALDLMRKNKFDLILINNSMKTNSGDNLLSLMRNFSNTSVILMIEKINVNPTFEILRNLDIQGCCERNSDLKVILLQVEMTIKNMHCVKSALLNFEFSEMFLSLRQSHGYTQEEVAKLIGVHKGTIIDFENGRSYPTYAGFLKIADLFKVNIDFPCGRIVYK